MTIKDLPSLIATLGLCAFIFYAGINQGENNIFKAQATPEITCDLNANIDPIAID